MWDSLWGRDKETYNELIYTLKEVIEIAKSAPKMCPVTPEIGKFGIKELKKGYSTRC